MKVEENNVHFKKEYVDIEGHRNGLFIESTDFNNPVLLFLEGTLNPTSTLMNFYWRQRIDEGRKEQRKTFVLSRSM